MSSRPRVFKNSRHPSTGVVEGIAPVSLEECVTCFTRGKLDKVVSNVDRLMDTLVNLQKDVLNVINILPKQSNVPVVQEEEQQGTGDIQGAPATLANNCRLIRHGTPLGFRRPMPFSRKKVYKVMKKSSEL